MTLVVMFFVVLVSALLQTVLPSFALLGHVKFPFLLAVVLYYAVNRNVAPMFAAAFCAGFMQDILTPMMPLGYSVICFCAIGWLFSLLRGLVRTDSPVICAVLGAIAGGVSVLLIYLLLLKTGLLVYPLGRVLLRVVASGMLASLCVPVVFVVTAKLDGVLGNVEIRENINGLS